VVPTAGVRMTVEKVTEAEMAETMLAQVRWLDSILREGPILTPADAVSVCMLYIAHVHRWFPKHLQIELEDMVQKYLSDMRTRRDGWQKLKT
jgi:hypothetical protein